MANLTNTQKKNRNKFVALCVAIVVVLAAIAVVVYNGLTVAPFGNADFEEAVAQAFGMKPGSVPKSTLEEVKYVEIANNGVQISAFFGYDDYFARMDEYLAEQEVISAAQTESDEKLEEMRKEAMEAAKAEAEAAGGTFDEEVFNTNFDEEEHDTGVEIPEAKVAHPVELTKQAAVASAGTLIDLNDIKYFKNAKSINVIGAKLDADTVLSLKNTENFTFAACEFDDIKKLAQLDFAKVESLSLDMSMLPTVTVVGEDGEETAEFDESVLELFKPYGEKVSLTSYLSYGDMYVPYGSVSVADYFAEEAEAEEGTEETAEEAVESTEP